MDLIRDMSRDARMSTLLITHDLGLAGEYCDRIAVMHAGHVVEVAPTEDAAAPAGASLHAAAAGRDADAAVDAWKDLVSIPGQLPDLRRDLPPCRFSARCERHAAGLRRDAAALDSAGRRRTSCAAGFRCDGAAARSARAGQALPGRSAARGAMLHAVDGVDLAIGPGECVGLVGESGCGKSTLVRLLARLIDPTAGRILLDGEDITAVSQARFVTMPQRARIQVVFQDPSESLNPSFRVFQSIADPLQRLLGVQRSGQADATGASRGRSGRAAARTDRALSAPVVRRPARARRHRARHRGRAVAADPGRADLGAGCLGAGGDPAAARRPAGAARR